MLSGGSARRRGVIIFPSLDQSFAAAAAATRVVQIKERKKKHSHTHCGAKVQAKKNAPQKLTESETKRGMTGNATKRCNLLLHHAANRPFDIFSRMKHQVWGCECV